MLCKGRAIAIKALVKKHVRSNLQVDNFEQLIVRNQLFGPTMVYISPLGTDIMPRVIYVLQPCSLKSNFVRKIKRKKKVTCSMCECNI